MVRFLFITFSFFLSTFALPQTAFASCSYMPNPLYYDIATALILWPAVFLIAIYIFDWAGAAITKHHNQIIKGGAILYLWLAVYALFADIPPDSFKIVLLAIMLSPPLIIASYCAYNVFRQAAEKQRRYYTIGAILLPYIGTAFYFGFEEALFPVLVVGLTCIGVCILATIFLVIGTGFSWKKRLVIDAIIVLVLSAIALASRPECCVAKGMREPWMSDDGCGCVCVYVPPVRLGQREQALKQNALEGDVAAQYEIGRFYFENSHSMNDDNTGLEWWRKAAEGGSRKAQKQMSLGAYGYAKDAERKKWQDVIDAEKNKQR